MTATRCREARNAAAVLLLAILPGLHASATEPEDEVKSVAVLNFLRYSTWPAPAAATLTVGVLGRHGFLDTLRTALESKLVNGRTVRVIEVKNAADAAACQVVYLATERSSEITPIVAGGREYWR